MHEVYRVEHPVDNVGPYQSRPKGFFEQEVDDYHQYILDRMGPDHSDDAHPVLHWTGMVSGTDSLGALKTWFGKYLEWLVECGFVVRRFLVPELEEVDYYTHQVLFRREHATMVEEVENHVLLS